ncbi:unnamed protein product [Nesidiocoris tenuis]|uniref:Uncharacterized protein n=1 Tax=Nesidiocoris tenuis TaxID=355587 RepID=A0A6H5FVI1_9HEMI|nr:unnamed protein product [Nesidiocoris tenuis]
MDEFNLPRGRPVLSHVQLRFPFNTLLKYPISPAIPIIYQGKELPPASGLGVGNRPRAAAEGDGGLPGGRRRWGRWGGGQSRPILRVDIISAPNPVQVPPPRSRARIRDRIFRKNSRPSTERYASYPLCDSRLRGRPCRPRSCRPIDRYPGRSELA